MLEIFHSIGELYGFPPTEQEDWIVLIDRALSDKVITETEHQKAAKWIELWAWGLQNFLEFHRKNS